MMTQQPTLSPDQIQHVTDQRYIERLEHLNQQLYLGWTPLATFITALGVLFAAGAIVAAVLIFWQSSSFKEQTKAAIARLDAVAEEARNVLASFQVEAEKELQALRDALGVASADLKPLIQAMLSSAEARQASAAIALGGIALRGSGTVTNPRPGWPPADEHGVLMYPQDELPAPSGDPKKP